jgi:hypothetical protein
VEKAFTNIAQELGLSSDGIEAKYIPGPLLPLVAEEILPFIQAGLNYGQNELNAMHVLNLAYVGDMFIFVAFEHGVPFAAVAAGFNTYNNYRTLQIYALGGRNLLRLRRFFPLLQQWAALQECIAIEAWTRPQMTRALSKFGFEKKYEIVRFSLKGNLQ